MAPGVVVAALIWVLGVRATNLLHSHDLLGWQARTVIVVLWPAVVGAVGYLMVGGGRDGKLCAFFGPALAMGLAGAATMYDIMAHGRPDLITMLRVAMLETLQTAANGGIGLVGALLAERLVRSRQAHQ